VRNFFLLYFMHDKARAAGALGVPEKDVSILKVNSDQLSQEILVTFEIKSSDRHLVALVEAEINGAGHKAEIADQLLDEMHTTGLTHAKRVSIVSMIVPQGIPPHKDELDDDSLRGMGITRGNFFFVWMLMAVAFASGRLC